MVRVVCCLITEIPQLNTTAEETSGCSVHKGLFLCEVIQCASRDNREKENTQQKKGRKSGVPFRKKNTTSGGRKPSLKIFTESLRKLSSFCLVSNLYRRSACCRRQRKEKRRQRLEELTNEKRQNKLW